MKIDLFKLDEANLTRFIRISVMIGLSGIIITISVFLIKGHINFNDIDAQKLSAFGEFIGGFIGVFFTLAATFLIWLTYKTQRQELQKTSNLAELQSKVLKTQQFENTYFSLLSHLSNLINSMTSDSQVLIEPSVQGKEYLHHAYRRFKDKIKEKGQSNIDNIKIASHTEEQRAELIRNVLVKIYEDDIFPYHSFNLGHYYRFIHNIIKYVISEYEDEKLQRKYLTFLQAQMSNDEMGFILVNSLSKYSLDKNNNTKFKDWIDYYNILENIDRECTFDDSILKIYFPKTDFYCLRKQSVV